MFRVALDTYLQTTNMRRGRAMGPRELVYQATVKVWKGAVRAFVLEAIKYIHIDTGMSMASLKPLGAKVGLRATIAREIQAGRKSTYGDPDKLDRGYLGLEVKRNGQKYDVWKSEAYGERIGADAFTLSFGSRINPKFEFSFDILVYQWAFWEEGNSEYPNHEAWNALEHGQTAFQQYFDTELPNAIDINKIHNAAMNQIFWNTQTYADALHASFAAATKHKRAALISKYKTQQLTLEMEPDDREDLSIPF